MEENYTIPQTLSDLPVGTEYQVLYIDGIWSSTRVVARLCWSTKNDLLGLIERNKIRIVNYE